MICFEESNAVVVPAAKAQATFIEGWIDCREKLMAS